jgi:hypothetical protein
VHGRGYFCVVVFSRGKPDFTLAENALLGSAPV